MKPIHMAMFASLFALLLPGCSTTPPECRESSRVAEWRNGDFRVRFQAAPRGENGKASSFYHITYAVHGLPERSLVQESAHSTGGFDSVANGDPKNWIRIIEDPNRRALLIEEEVPNDCGPCSNYLWVHLDSQGVPAGTYLLLPSKTTGTSGGIDYEYPKVRSLESDVLTYEYSVGTGVTTRIQQVEKADRPTPPG